MTDQQWTSVHVFLPPYALDRVLELLAAQHFPTVASYVDDDGRALVREAHMGEGRDRDREGELDRAAATPHEHAAAVTLVGDVWAVRCIYCLTAMHGTEALRGDLEQIIAQHEAPSPRKAITRSCDAPCCSERPNAGSR